MDGALRAGAPRQCHVQPFGAQPFVQRGIAQCGLFRGERGIDLVLQGVQRGAGDLPFFGRHLAQFAHLQRNLALFADGTDADILKRGFICGICDLIKVFALKIVHHGPPGNSSPLCYHKGA